MHRAVAGVDQHRIVSTIRGTEVAADPTVVLAVEAAQRRRRLIQIRPTDDTMIVLAGFQRVARGQQFDDPNSFAHFAISGLVTAGRDVGSEVFERSALDLHLRHIADGCRALGVESVEILLSDFTGGRLGGVIDDLAASFSTDRVSVAAFPARTRARGYYTDLALEVHVTIAGERLEIGDGGMTDWTQKVVASRKVRCLISGLGVERLALALALAES
jgi:hypothetical protein